MSLDIATVKRRRNVMLMVNGLALLAAVAGAVGYFVYAQAWALLAFVAALIAGFGAQIWFIVGLRGPHSSSEESARETRVGRGA